MKKNRTTFIIIGLLIIIALALGYSLINQDEKSDIGNQVSDTNDNEVTEDPKDEGTSGALSDEPVPAPEFDLSDLNGNTVSLSDFKGRYVFLNFWASWCGPCKEEMPDMEQIHQTYGDEIEILAVNLGEDENVAEGFRDDYGLTFKILLDQKKEVAMTYQVTGIPTSYFIDKEGNIAYGYMGTMSYELMEEYISQLKKE
ncbi:TlpA family protein disulfide reductase [Alkalibacter mobilis]|uniref:TlpA family protein disulfide reductase n=1 Tax=Alkalibacter mobilis TaxID=2787712 RepID=UPI00189D79F2|nr:TlpA disulfide reductase family protein [Alkalibacter mobilis]MBF7097657.1 TlpA family protein disulfide reductase [Alkalibacter mobilis]